ncbi:MAG: hypothetical protein IJX89_00975 [Alphaproteobacteria bacterium]|nr:hypothetical protein [Alphaproteobacteria bacterium]
MKLIKTIIGASAICIVTSTLYGYTDPLGQTVSNQPDEFSVCPEGTFMVCMYIATDTCFQWGCYPCPTDCTNGYYNKCTETDGTTCNQWQCTKCESASGISIKTGKCAVQKSDCYIPANSSITNSDSTGTYQQTYTTDCYYSD